MKSASQNIKSKKKELKVKSGIVKTDRFNTPLSSDNRNNQQPISSVNIHKSSTSVVEQEDLLEVDPAELEKLEKLVSTAHLDVTTSGIIEDIEDVGDEDRVVISDHTDLEDEEDLDTIDQASKACVIKCPYCFEDVIVTEEMLCPLCGKRVILKKGTVISDEDLESVYDIQDEELLEEENTRVETSNELTGVRDVSELIEGLPYQSADQYSLDQDIV